MSEAEFDAKVLTEKRRPVYDYRFREGGQELIYAPDNQPLAQIEEKHILELLQKLDSIGVPTIYRVVAQLNPELRLTDVTSRDYHRGIVRHIEALKRG